MDLELAAFTVGFVFGFFFGAAALTAVVVTYVAMARAGHG